MYGREVGREKLNNSRTDIHTGGRRGNWTVVGQIYIQKGGRENFDSTNALREPNYSIKATFGRNNSSEKISS